MKLVRRNDEEVVFHLTRSEKKALLFILERYPVLPLDFQPPSRGDNPGSKIDQTLLREMLAEQKRQNQEFLRKLFEQKDRFQPVHNGWHFKLLAGEVEWFLQVLNDVRVGEWHKAGCPDELSKMPVNSSEARGHAWAMEISGFFICSILELLNEI